MPPNMSARPMRKTEKPALAWRELSLPIVQPPVLRAMKPAVKTRAMAKKPKIACTILDQRQ